MGRGKSWRDEEDEALTRAWLSANEDRLANREDTSSIWQKIYELFNEVSPASQRSLKALESHWTMLLREINKFSGIHTRLSGSPDNALSEEEIIQAALATFEVTTGYAFKHLGCWKMLQSAPNFKSRQRIKTEWSQEEQAERIDDSEVRAVKKAKVQHENNPLPPQKLPLPRVKPVVAPKPLTPIRPRPSQACTAPNPSENQAAEDTCTSNGAQCLTEVETRQIEADLFDIVTALPALKRLVPTQEFDNVLSSLAHKAKALQAQPEAARQRLAASVLDFTKTGVSAVSQEFTIRRSNKQALVAQVNSDASRTFGMELAMHAQVSVSKVAPETADSSRN
ncbi:hypothetical protein V7S43_007371 [Phytophthora oleae]|uniref:Myb-like domain-containing protein n=1 Tax=Phytophthora oleae TaxID=2107226 RepID=A0ABD3FN06_9STRA